VIVANFFHYTRIKMFWCFAGVSSNLQHVVLPALDFLVLGSFNRSCQYFPILV
jgi:hypothetical protein